MFGEKTETIVDDLTPLNKSAKQQRKIASTIVGGNLTLVSRMIETPLIDIRGKILLLEEVDEPFRKVDGIIQQFKLAGYFQNDNAPIAVLLGKFSASEPIEETQVNNCLERFAKELDEDNVPVLQCLNIGHGEKNHPIPLGTNAILQLGEKSFLTVQSGGVQPKLDVSLFLTI